MKTVARLTGKTALITGAGQGIGRSTAQIFAREGAKLFIIGRSLDKLNAVAEEINRAGPSQAMAMKADVTDPMQVKEAVKAMIEAFGRIDILINNAGVALTRPFTETSLEDIDFLININVKGIVLTSQAVIPHMAKSGGGSIVHDASNAGIVGRPWQAVYGASKAAVISLTKSMALSLASQNIRVNCVCPGSIDTPMLRNALSKGGNFEESWRRTEMVTPLGRIGDPEDIAYATLFLACDESKFITGVSLPVDGGRTVGIPETFHVGMAIDK
jgi:NAD(P)-dependent dehydrogenase (short-subunit alcohol dehydrogenase family)